jgi:hypothetical protein
MGVMSPKLLAEAKKYRLGLIKRVLKAPCPHCKAKPGETCVGKLGSMTKTGIQHASRHNEAKRLGFIEGKWFDEKKWRCKL